jgi:hypothetical protein
LNDKCYLAGMPVCLRTHSQEDWQCLFLVWFRGASVGELLAVDLPVLVDLTRWIGCRLDEVDDQGSLRHRLTARYCSP